ncbi:DUF2218 domain-containing protein [Amorphus sp. 3PC139-8]|uniref:DUF2218 domain-containing protein n=1 Tax=Amorphus sp. 3PC139-8 TaxID=2735676 RepID=UPI00345DE3C4
MVLSEGRIATAAASKYLQQLCKHFRHKVDVEFDAARGQVTFPFGVCWLEAREDELVMRCEAPDAEASERMQSVIAVHLERFAWREKAVVAWTPLSTPRAAAAR